MAYTTRELSVRTLPDFESLAVKQGQCWCMFYQRPKPIGRELSSEERRKVNRKDKALLVRQGRSHAVLVYEGKTAVGWCQYGTQDELPRIDAKDDWPLRWISTSERARSRLKDLPPLATEMPHVGPIAPMCTL